MPDGCKHVSGQGDSDCADPQSCLGYSVLQHNPSVGGLRSCVFLSKPRPIVLMLATSQTHAAPTGSSRCSSVSSPPCAPPARAVLGQGVHERARGREGGTAQRSMAVRGWLLGQVLRCRWLIGSAIRCVPFEPSAEKVVSVTHTGTQETTPRASIAIAKDRELSVSHYDLKVCLRARRARCVQWRRNSSAMVWRC